MKDVREVVDTPLAQWLNHKMGEWIDPETGRGGLTANRLADLSGVSQTLVFEILKVGKTTPKAETLVKLAEFFGESPIHLLRITYLPESESDDFPAEVRAKFVELENILARVPASVQMEFMESLVSQARMLRIAASSWDKIHA